MTTKPLIFIGTPCFGGLVSQGYMQSVLELVQYSSAKDFEVTLALLGHDALITRARNTIVSAFLNSTAASHLLFIDSDIVFRPEQIHRMLNAGKDMVAGMYPLKVLDWDLAQKRPSDSPETPEEAALHYVGTLCTGDELERDGAFTTGVYAGTGFMMITRALVERMVESYTALRYNGIHAYPRRKATPDTQYALFECMIEPETGTYLSEDYAFCHRWRALGGKIWLDTEGKLTHIGAHDYPGNPALRFPGQASQM